MPEIPEMEIYRSFLEKSVLGKAIVETKVNREKSINFSEEQLKRLLNDTCIEKVERCGKAILLRLSNARSLYAHMMLDGRIYLAQSEEDTGFPGKSHVQFTLNDRTILHFCEMRLGYIKLLNRQEAEDVVSKLGIDPLSVEFTLEKCKTILNHKKGMIKPLLMDQKIISGIGNAYSNETLFAAGVHPERKAASIGDAFIRNLYNAIQTVLNEAIAKGGYIEEPFSSLDTLSGGYIPYFKVYDRTGKPCVNCNSTIMQKFVGGRNAYYCEVCQK